MTDVEKMLHDLASAARADLGPEIDVRSRVIQTLSEPARIPPLERTPFVLGGVAVVVAVVGTILLIPKCQSMFDPWSTYLQL